MRHFTLLVSFVLLGITTEAFAGSFCELAYSLDRISTPTIYKNRQPMPPYSYPSFNEAVDAFRALVAKGECNPNPLTCDFYPNPTGSNCSGYQGFQRSYRVTKCVHTADEIFAAAAKLFTAQVCGDIVFHNNR